MLYFALSIICSALPWINRFSIIPFITLLVTIPIANSLSEYFYKFGIFFFDFYFFSLFVKLAFGRGLRAQETLTGFVVVILYAFTAIVSSNIIDKYVVRDFRLIIHLVSLLGLMSLARQSVKISGRIVVWLAILSGFSCLFFAYCTYAGYFKFDDPFYIQHSDRYFAVSSYFCFGFFAFSSFLPQKERKSPLYYFALLLCFVGILLTGLRAMIVIGLVLFMLPMLKSRNGILSVCFIMSLILAMSFAFISDVGNFFPISRLQRLSPQFILSDLQVRFSPFWDVVTNFTYLEFVFGGGFGQTFQIPWFEHRPTKDVVNNFVDSTYLTLFAKLGMVSIILLHGYIVAYSRILMPTGPRYVAPLTLSLMALFCVYAIPYQSSAIGLALAVFSIGCAARFRSKCCDSNGLEN